MVKLGNQGIVKAVDVIDNHRFLVLVELSPGGDFQNLLERSQSAWQGDKGAGTFRHQGLAFMHAFDDMQFGQLAVRNFIVQHKFGNHPHHFTAMLKHGVGNLTHQANAGTAIDNPETLRGNMLGQFNGCVTVNGFVACTGTAI